ncbi:MAG TPA: LamG-like jellyroll fold domain-containing protein, partial [archaeon]|nr:LamG-like jellyroll fold domain-containing protein [archaeon]
IFTNNNTATSGIDYSLTLFAKKGEYDKLRIEDGNNSKGAWFDLSNGTLGTVGGGVVAKIENYGNGWYRCSVIKPSITGNIFFVIYSSNIESVQVGDGTSGIYIWGAMLEQQSYATSYIPTNGAASTRLQDIANNSGNATLINSTEGVLYAEVATLVDPTSVMIIGLSDGTVANRLSITFHSTLNRIQIFAQKNSFQLFNIDNTSVSKTNFNKIAISYNSTSAKFFLNGTLVASAIPSDMFTANTLDRLNFDIGSGSNKFHGKTKALVVYKEALTDEQLICLTTI